MVQIVETNSSSKPLQKEHLIFIDKVVSKINEFDDLEQNVQINGYYYDDPVNREKIWINSSKQTNLINQFSNLSLNKTNTKLYIPEYDYEHDKPEDILKSSANSFDYERFIKEWNLPNTPTPTNNQSTVTKSRLPNYYNQTITSMLNENQTKLIYNTENSNKSNKLCYNSSSSSTSSSNSSNNELKYVMYLVKSVKDDQEVSDKSLVVLNNTKLKNEIESNLGIFSNVYKNNFNPIKIKKHLCEFIPGKEKMPACDIEITITAEDLSQTSSQDNKNKLTDDSSCRSNTSSKSFTQEAKQILADHKVKFETNSNLKLVSSDSTLNISDLSETRPPSSDNSSEYIYCQMSDASTQNKQKRILNKANERHKNKKHYKKKKNRNSSSERLAVKMKKKKKVFIYANEPPIEKVYDSFEDTKEDSELVKETPTSVLIDTRETREEHLYDTVDIKDEEINDTNFRHVRQDSFLLNKILLLDPNEKNKKDAQMFHTDKYLRNKTLFEQAETYLKEINEKKRQLENKVTEIPQPQSKPSTSIYPIQETKSEIQKETKQDLENEGDEEEIEMKSDSETGEKVPANNKRRSSTAMFVNYHFLSKQEKNAINNMNNDEMETEESSSFLSKIPIIKEFAGSRRSSNANTEVTEEERKKLEESIQDEIEKKKEIINSDINEADLIAKDDKIQINPAQLSLLTKYRRESSALPYYESFFANPEKSSNIRRGSSESVEEKPPARVNNIITNRRKSSDQIESLPKIDPANNTRRRNSTAAFVNYHFLAKNDKMNINKNSSESFDNDEETKSSILSKIPIIGSRIESRRNSNASQQEPPEDLIARKRLEDSIIDDIEKKKELLNLDLQDAEIEKKQEAQQLNLNPSQKALLNKYRRESLTTLPYADSFFSSSKSPTNQAASADVATSDDNKSISSLTNQQTVSAKTMELHNKFKKTVTSPINNEAINLIEELPPSQETDSLKNHRKRSSITNDSRISLTDEYENNSLVNTISKEKSVTNSAASSRASSKSKQSVFKKLKTKFREKFEK